jgi:hypothetical protein
MAAHRLSGKRELMESSLVGQRTLPFASKYSQISPPVRWLRKRHWQSRRMEYLQIKITAHVAQGHRVGNCKIFSWQSKFGRACSPRIPLTKFKCTRPCVLGEFESSEMMHVRGFPFPEGHYSINLPFNPCVENSSPRIYSSKRRSFCRIPSTA